MSSNDGTDRQSCIDDRARGLHGLERNRYFNRKLMTARDMEAEQDYHVTRLNTFARLVSGEGTLCGLNVLDIQRNGDDLDVKISEGAALDCDGTLVVVGKDATETVSAPAESTDLRFYLRYAQCAAEYVPLPNGSGGCRDECEYNRIVETFDVVARPVDGDATGNGPKNKKEIPELYFPSYEDTETFGRETALSKMAWSYYGEDPPAGTEGAPETDPDRHLRECEACEDDERCVYLGRYERGEGDGTSWEPHVETERRPLIYGNDMLFAGLAGHVERFDNPHELFTAVEEAEPDSGSEASAARVRIDDHGEADHPGADEGITLESEDVTFEVDSEDGRIGLVVTPQGIGALKSINGVTNTDANVDLRPDDEYVKITAHDVEDGEDYVGIAVTGLAEHIENRENPHEVGLTARRPDGRDRGALVSALHLDDPEHSVTFDSPDRSVSIDVHAGIVEVDLTGGEEAVVAPRDNQRFVGTVEPNQAVTVRIRGQGENGFLKEERVTADGSGRFAATFDFSDIAVDTAFQIELRAGDSVLEAVDGRVEDLPETPTVLLSTGQLENCEPWVLGRSIHSKRRCFSRVVDALDARQDDSADLAIRLANRIVRRSTVALAENVHESASEYREFIFGGDEQDGIWQLELDLHSELESAELATMESLDQYLGAVKRLDRTQRSPSALAVAVAQQRVCDAAEMLVVIYPEEREIIRLDDDITVIRNIWPAVADILGGAGVLRIRDLRFADPDWLTEEVDSAALANELDIRLEAVPGWIDDRISEIRERLER